MPNRKAEEFTHKSRFNTLIVLLSLFGFIWFSSIQFLRNLGFHRDLYPTGDIPLLGMALAIFSFPLFIHLLKIIKTIYHETKRYTNSNSNYHKKQAKKDFRYVMSEWYWVLVPIFLSLILKFFSLLPTKLLVIGILGVGVFVMLIYMILSIRLGGWWYSLLLIGFVAYYILVVTLTTGVEITLDKNIYYVGDEVRYEVRPYGFVPPLIVNATYFNEKLLFNLNKDDPYHASRRYDSIPGDFLVEEPYNSHIIVTYTHFSQKFFGIGHKIGNHQLKTVPVYPSDSRTPYQYCEVYKQNSDCTYLFS